MGARLYTARRAFGFDPQGRNLPFTLLARLSQVCWAPSFDKSIAVSTASRVLLVADSRSSFPKFLVFTIHFLLQASYDNTPPCFLS
mgnify:CR=1 FL=1